MESEAVDRRAVDVLARQLELCRTAPGSAGVVLADSATDPALLDTAVHALDQIGAVPSTISIDDLPLSGEGADPPSPDIVVNLLNGYSDAVETLVSPNARVLSVVAHCTGELRGVVPHTGLARRVKRGMDLFEAGRELNVGDTNGTSLRIGLNGARRWKHDGLASYPGVAAEWPRGIIGTAPAAGSAEGTVVMSPGDIWLPMGWYARSTVALTFEAGRLVGIEGQRSETDAVRAQLASVGSQAAFRLDAVEIGLLWNDRPRPPALFEPGFADSFGIADRHGHVVIATGEYPMVGIACCLREATVAVDEVAAVRSGRLQGELAPDVYEQAAHRHPL